jgi:pilus assembly protein CpaD
MIEVKSANSRATGDMRAWQSRLRLICGVLLAAPALGGCAGALRPLPPPASPYDYKDRHPIVLSQERFVLDVFPRQTGGRLDPDTKGRLVAFAGRYAEFGDGPIVLAIPVGSASAKFSAREAAAVAQALTAAGAPRVEKSEYPVADPALAAPIRLSFTGLRAKVAGRCGLWPRDLASASSLDGWQNETYWNFGCATQNMIATQTADPHDLVSPRGETPADVEMRMKGILKLRQGSDSATNSGGKAGSISGVGG